MSAIGTASMPAGSSSSPPSPSSLSPLPPPIPVGAGALGRAAAGAERQRRQAARARQRIIKAQEQALLPALMRGAAAGVAPSAEDLRAEAARRPAPVPAFGAPGSGPQLDGPLLSARRAGGGGRSPIRRSRKPAHVAIDNEGDLAHQSDGGGSASAAAAATTPTADAEVSRINRDGGIEVGAAEQKESTGAAQGDTQGGDTLEGASDSEAEIDTEGEERDGDSLAMEAALAEGSSTLQPINSGTAMAPRQRKLGLHGRKQQSSVGGGGLRRGPKHQQHQSSGAFSRGLGDDSASASLSSLVQEGTSRSLVRRYQLSEEEKKISAYYSTIQSAASKVAQSIEALLPGEGDEQDAEALVQRWTRQGLGEEEIRIRLEHRGTGSGSGSGAAEAEGKGDGSASGSGGGGGNSVPLNEHDAYRKSFVRLHQLLDGMSTSNLTAVGRGGGSTSGSAFSEQQYREYQEEQERAEAIQRQREEEEAEARATKEAEEAAARAAADDEAAAEAAADAVGDSFRSPDVSDSDESEDEEAALARVRGVAARSGTGGASSSAHPSSTSSSSSVAAAAASSHSGHSPASVYRDLHNFFTGKRRTELMDNKRLQLLETQTAAQEESGEAARAAVTEGIKLKAEHTTSVLQGYHRNLQSTSRQLGPAIVRPAGAHPSSGAKAAAASGAQQRASGLSSASASAEEIASQRVQLELVVATLQARVAEQDELLASIGVADGATETPSHGPSFLAPSPGSAALFTYDSNAHLSRSFESKASHLYKVVSTLQGALRARQAERLALEEGLGRSQDAIARLLMFENQAAMEQREREDSERREAELQDQHASTMGELRAAAAAAEARFHEVATRNHALSLTLQSVEAELGAIHALRESEADKTAQLRAKHKKECVAIMRGQIPKHLVGLMGRSHLAAARRADAMSVGPGGDLDLDLEGYADPAEMAPQLALKDEEVEALQLDEAAMSLADWEAAEAAEAARIEALSRPAPVLLSPEQLAAQAAAAEAERLAAEEAALDVRAQTPVSKLRRTVDKTYAQIAAQEMAYLPWQAELFLTLQPRYNNLVEEMEELQGRLREQQQARRAWEARRKEEEEEGESKAKEDGEEEGEEGEDDEEGSEQDQSESDASNGDASAPAGAGAGGAAPGKFKPKQYARRVREKTYLADKPGAKKAARRRSDVDDGAEEADEDEEEGPELREARERMGHNQYVSQQIRSFALVTAPSNALLAKHLALLKTDHASLHGQVETLMAKWAELSETDRRVQRMETTEIQPTRRRISVVQGHVERIQKAIDAKVAWLAAKAEVTRLKEEQERKEEEAEVARIRADEDAMDAHATAESRSPPADSAPTAAAGAVAAASAAPSGSPRLTGAKTRSRRPSIASMPTAGADGVASRASSRSRRPSVAQANLLGEGVLTPAAGLSSASSGSRPISHHGRHSRNASTGGGSGSGSGLARKSHRPIIKKDDVHGLATTAAHSPLVAAAATPSSPTALVAPEPGGAGAGADTDSPPAPLLDEVSLTRSNAQLASEAAALQDELALLELEQEALMLSCPDTEAEKLPEPALQWMLAQAQAASLDHPVGAAATTGADAAPTGDGSTSTTSAGGSVPAQRASVPFVSLTPLQQSSMAIVSEAEAQASQPQQIVSAYEQLKADMVMWKQNALMKTIQERKDAAVAAAAAAASAPVSEQEPSDATEAADAPTADSAASSVLPASVSLALASHNAPRWAPGPAIVSITLPSDLQGSGGKSAATSAASEEDGPSAGDEVATETAASSAHAPKAIKATPVNIDATALLPSTATPASVAPTSPTKLHGRPLFVPAVLIAATAAALAADAASQDAVAPAVASSSTGVEASAAPSPASAVPPIASFAPLQVLGFPVAPDFAHHSSGRGAQKPLRSSLEKAPVAAPTVPSSAAAAHQSRQTALGGAMADFVSSHAESDPNAVTPRQAHAQRRRAANARSEAVEKRLDALPPFSARSMSIATAQPLQQHAPMSEQPASARAAPKQRAGAGMATGLGRGVGVQGKKVQPTKQTKAAKNAAAVPQADATDAVVEDEPAVVVDAELETSAEAPTLAETDNYDDAAESTQAPSSRRTGLVAAPAEPPSSSSFQLTPLPFDSAHATVPEEEEENAEETSAAIDADAKETAVDEQAPGAGSAPPVAVPLSMVTVDLIAQLPRVQAGETSQILGGGIGAPTGAPLSIAHKPVMGGGIHLASTVAHEPSAASPSSSHPHQHASKAPVLLVSAAPIKLQPKQTAQTKLATSMSAESLVVPSPPSAEHATSAQSAASMRRAQSQASLAQTPRGTLPMRTTNLGAMMDQQQPLPSSFEHSSSSPSIGATTTAGTDFAQSLLGIPSFATPLPQSFHPKVAKKSVKEQAEQGASATGLNSSSSGAALPSREQPSAAGAHSLHRSSTLPPSIPLGAGLGLSSSGSVPSLDSGGSATRAADRQRSLSPPSRKAAAASSSSDASGSGGAAAPPVAAAPVFLSASASSGRLVPASPAISFVSARDRADALAHSALLDQFSRILSPSELHTVAQHTSRLRVQGAGGAAATTVAAANSGALSDRSATHGSHSSPDRRATSGGMAGLLARPGERESSLVLAAAAAAAVSSPAQLVADARRLQHAASASSRSPRHPRSSRSRVPSHMQSMLSVRASTTATAATTNTVRASPAPPPPHPQQPALDASVVAYLASLHAPQPTQPNQPAPASTITSPRKQKARDHANNQS